MLDCEDDRLRRMLRQKCIALLQHLVQIQRSTQHTPFTLGKTVHELGEILPRLGITETDVQISGTGLQLLPDGERLALGEKAELYILCGAVMRAGEHQLIELHPVVQRRHPVRRAGHGRLVHPLRQRDDQEGGDSNQQHGQQRPEDPQKYAAKSVLLHFTCPHTRREHPYRSYSSRTCRRPRRGRACSVPGHRRQWYRCCAWP